MDDLFAKLESPFPTALISWRVGSMTKDKSKARALAYIDARDVMRRLDEACTPGGWQNKHEALSGSTVCCSIGIKIGDEWIWKANGAGASDIEGEKGAISDSFKRAAVLWGIGRYLYDIDSPWLPLNEWKQFDPKDVAGLQRLLPGPRPTKAQSRDDWKALAAGLKSLSIPSAVDEYLREHREMIARMPEGWRKNWDDSVSAVRDAVQSRVAA